VTPIGGVAGGLLLAFVDVRLGGLDVLADVAGWVLVAVSLGKLTDRFQSFAYARTAAIFTALLSLADLFEPKTTVTTSDGTTTFTETVAATPTGLRAAALFVYMIMLVVTPAVVCWAIQRAAEEVRDEGTARSFGYLTFATVGLGVVGFLLDLTSGSADDGGTGGAVALLIVSFAVYIWMMITLYAIREHEYLEPAG
jgi:hypothetical protein